MPLIGRVDTEAIIVRESLFDTISALSTKIKARDDDCLDSLTNEITAILDKDCYQPQVIGRIRFAKVYACTSRAATKSSVQPLFEDRIF